MYNTHNECVHISGHTHSSLVTNQELPVALKVVEIYTMYTELNEMITFTLSLFNYLLLIPTILVLGLGMKPFETFTKAKINFKLGAIIRLFVHPLAS